MSEDYLSQAEMEICAASDVFIWSKQSTWSHRVVKIRKIIKNMPNDFDDNIISLVVNVLDGT